MQNLTILLYSSWVLIGLGLYLIWEGQPTASIIVLMTSIIVSAIAIAGRAVIRAKQAPRYFDVHDFGAKGDGVTDDTEAVNRAMDAAREVDGFVWVRTNHTYNLNGPLRHK